MGVGASGFYRWAYCSNCACGDMVLGIVSLHIRGGDMMWADAEVKALLEWYARNGHLMVTVHGADRIMDEFKRVKEHANDKS